ncbi:hypothetical protein BH23BAC1_BH23BAC1_20300 [soil metagenome]
MKRRKFLKFLGLGSTVVAIPAISLASNSFNQSVIGLIKNDLSYLDLDEKGLENFVQDYFKENPESNLYKLKLLYMFRVTSKNSYTVEKISKHYLMGSDFFRNKMDETKKVYYTGLYNPFKSPCAHPFNNIYYPENSIYSKT